MKIDDCTVCILAGGKGTRLKNVTKNGQKVVAEINGTNVLKFILEQLRKDGFTEVFILTGYRSYEVKESLKNYSLDLDLIFSEEKKPLGTGGAVKLVSEKINKDYLLVINGDTIINFSRKRFLENIRSNRNFMLSVRVNDVSRFGEIKYNDNLEITAMNEKQGIIKAGYINAGTYILNRQNILNFNKSIFSLENDYFQEIIKKRLLYVATFNFDFLDIGIPEDFTKAANFLS